MGSDAICGSLARTMCEYVWGKKFYYSLASTVAGSSWRNSESTTSRRSFMLNFDLDPIFQSLSIFVSSTA